LVLLAVSNLHGYCVQSMVLVYGMKL